MVTESKVPAERAVALSPAQRLHLNVYGYVLLEDVLTPAEIKQAKAALYRLKAEPDERLNELRVYRRQKGPHHVLMDTSWNTIRRCWHTRSIPSSCRWSRK